MQSSFGFDVPKFSRVKGNQIWEVYSEEIGPFYFSFDKKKIYNFWSDYWDLSEEQRKLFDKEFPEMAALKNPDVPEPAGEDDEDYEPEYEYSN